MTFKLCATTRLVSKKGLSTSLLQPRRNLSTGRNVAGCEESDVVIVGGGPAGLALASALGANSLTMIIIEAAYWLNEGASQTIRESLQITLVEAGDLSKVRDWEPHPASFSNRVSSLTNASRHFLQGIVTRI